MRVFRETVVDDTVRAITLEQRLRRRERIQSDNVPGGIAGRVRAQLVDDPRVQVPRTFLRRVFEHSVRERGRDYVRAQSRVSRRIPRGQLQIVTFMIRELSHRV